MDSINQKFAKHGDLYEAIRDPLDHDIVPWKYYIIVPQRRVVKGSYLIKELPTSPLGPSNGRQSRLADYEDCPDRLEYSDGRKSRMSMYEYKNM
jgi:hypothetical protein